MYNCILAGGDNIGLAFEMADISNYHGDYNLFHNDNPDRAITVAYTDEFSLQQIQNGDWTSYSNQDIHSIVAFNDTDIFFNPSNNDLHLFETSAAVNNGTSSSAPSIDFDGNPRPSGQGYDIGVYEYQFPNDIGENSFKSNKTKFVLYQNHPNPFNPKTIAQYHIPEFSFVTLKVFDVLGNVITTLVNEEKPNGIHSTEFNAGQLPSGIYLYQLHTPSFTQTKKMILLK
ncbi:MAG: T9SS type A sorting domain-containing protein [Ignavibacteria bacterium]|nr:T9SS type A sorting domain-containing protein [Ignavibacteria bacterium]MBT8382766.1 T9SS type A sorting domain-containing protein [Ignavibacteria bacterium]MBT8392711.1 T9SS type A sorting domain-containing protein [Ignavibacteria bacterium]NNJ52399.1 T9SS type A sorting domain-containing protein [Ignavibacteriaceae bacterium]NNL20911.1 T9SS type A sorting domain-containing protein [Ignavibacteriaceae bacterium]